jgi:hypothetical protein
MGDVVYLVKSKSKPLETARPASAAGSMVLIEVERGQLRETLINTLTSEDAAVLLAGLAMAIVRVIRAQQIL